MLNIRCKLTIHLGDWYRDVLALRTKWETYKHGDVPEVKEGRRQCKYEIERLRVKTLASSVISVVSFILVLSVLAFLLILNQPVRNPEWIYASAAGSVFLLLFLFMIGYYIFEGKHRLIAISDGIAEHPDFKQPTGDATKPATSEDDTSPTVTSNT